MNRQLAIAWGVAGLSVALTVTVITLTFTDRSVGSSSSDPLAQSAGWSDVTDQAARGPALEGLGAEEIVYVDAPVTRSHEGEEEDEDEDEEGGEEGENEERERGERGEREHGERGEREERRERGERAERSERGEHEERSERAERGEHQ